MNEKDGLSWLWFCKNRAMEFLAKTSVSVKILTGWVVAITLPGEPTSVLRGWQTQILWSCHDFLGKRYGFDNIVGAYVHMDETNPTHAQNHSSHLWRKENKYRHSAKDMFNRTDLKSFHKDLSVRLEREFGFDVCVWKQAEKMSACLTKSIKELKAEIRMAELKIVAACWMKAEWRIKRLKRENKENVGEWIAC